MKKIALFSSEKQKSCFSGKQKFFVLLGLICLILSGCLVKSLHPFYKPSDLVFRQDIIGAYTDQNKGVWKIEGAVNKNFLGVGKSDKQQNYYKISLLDEKKRTTTFQGCLFKLDNNYYVDFYLEKGNNDDAQTELYSYHVIGVHTVAKVLIGKNSLRIKWYNEKWLSELFEQNKIRLSHEKIEDNDAVVLTASTNELQQFMRKFANDPKAFQKKDKEKQDEFEYVLTKMPLF
ncbi:MAG: hypothetical protein HXX14_06935 [Bacteroidetes bacterium]|nr:hypothetical protein [Bacteroidota bacterium]